MRGCARRLLRSDGVPRSSRAVVRLRRRSFPPPPVAETRGVEAVVASHEFHERRGGVVRDADDGGEAEGAVAVGVVEVGESLERRLAQEREDGVSGRGEVGGGLAEATHHLRLSRVVQASRFAEVKRGGAGGVVVVEDDRERRADVLLRRVVQRPRRDVQRHARGRGDARRRIPAGDNAASGHAKAVIGVQRRQSLELLLDRGVHRRRRHRARPLRTRNRDDARHAVAVAVAGKAPMSTATNICSVVGRAAPATARSVGKARRPSDKAARPGAHRSTRRARPSRFVAPS